MCQYVIGGQKALGFCHDLTVGALSSTIYTMYHLKAPISIFKKIILLKSRSKKLKDVDTIQQLPSICSTEETKLKPKMTPILQRHLQNFIFNTLTLANYHFVAIYTIH
jgi:hypothetical protein